MDEPRSRPLGALQGRDVIDVDAPAPVLWRLIANSSELPSWGPPVTDIEVLNSKGESEGIGAARRVDAEFGRKSGYFVEHRVEHVPGRKVAYLIDEDSFGLSRVIVHAGFALELAPLDPVGTRVTFSFFHDPRGIAGRLLNPVIKLRQRRNRLEALEALKCRAEEIATS